MKSSPYSPHYEDLRAWLKQRRSESGLTLREAAKSMGRHHSVVGKIEQERKKIEIVEFIKYCQTLGADPHEGLDVLIQSLEKNADHLL